MTLLLDTRIWLWLLTAPERLGPLRSALEEESTALLLSAASSWEIAVEHAPALAAGGLPRRRDDPFDRLLVAQRSDGRATLRCDHPTHA